MEQTSEYEDEQIDDVPSPAVVLGRNEQRYGSVPGLDDDELADPDELERQAIMAELEPHDLRVMSGGSRFPRKCLI